MGLSVLSCSNKPHLTSRFVNNMPSQPGNSPEFSAYVLAMMELQKTLNQDTDEAHELFRFATPEFCTRTIVRTMSAEFEAMIYFLAEFLVKLNCINSEVFNLTPEELNVLKSESLTIKRNGDISITQKFYPFQERMLFVLKMAAKILNPDAMPNTDDSNWAKVKTFIKIRNRLTHPKSLSDLHITDNEVDDLNGAQDWVRTSVSALFTAGSNGEELAKFLDAHNNKPQ